MPSPNTHNEIRIRRNKVTLSTVPGEFKGTVSRKNRSGDYTLKFKIKFFCLAFGEYGEYAKLRKSIKTGPFSVIIGPTLKTDVFFLS